jgi:hypothetical protein
MLAERVIQLLGSARQQHLTVDGIQLDVDSPTSGLRQYAKFLQELRASLPNGTAISITVLLDWFRNGTAIGDVVKAVDEYVPQFYDVADGYRGEQAIAAKVDAGRWGPIFNRLQKRYRIGISTFGRARLVREGAAEKPGFGVSGFYGDLTPLDIASNSAFTLQMSRNDAGETALSYRAGRKVEISYNRFELGDTVQFILPTAESVRAAWENAKKMGGYCGGVIFFRWPASNEVLAMQPDQVFAAAGLIPREQSHETVLVVDGGCAAVSCVDLLLTNSTPLSPKPQKYHIRSSIELEYFLPAQNTPVRMAGPSELELSLPPYGGRNQLYLGRAVTAARAQFTLEKTH